VVSPDPSLNGRDEERALIERAKVDPDAFGELYRKYVDRIFSYILYRVGDREEAEDLTAKVFMRAMGHIGRYVDRGLPFSAWLYRIARNLVANWYRDRSKRTMVAIENLPLKDKKSGPEQLASSMESSASLLSAIRRLPEERQELLVLKFVERMSNANIGRTMGRSEGAIKSLYHRTLLSLRDELTLEEHQGLNQQAVLAGSAPKS